MTHVRPLRLLHLGVLGFHLLVLGGEQDRLFLELGVRLLQLFLLGTEQFLRLTQ